MKKLLLGNQAVARGAWEAGCKVATAYPGTPSTEITENIAKYYEIYSEWSPNEKVALEVGIGASYGGARTIVSMKHVGLNVAADPFFTLSYTGVNGGLVIAVADDPGMHSSQNEQDTRLIGRSAHVPVLEPSDSMEAKEFTKIAFDLSEKYDTPVILRLTTRVSHSRGLVEVEDRKEVPLKDYTKDISKHIMMPGMARKRHIFVEQRDKLIEKDASAMPINNVTYKDKKIGIITSGLSYQYVKEALPDASILKLGLVYPLPYDLIEEFSQNVERLIVVEELEPFIEDAIKAKGIACEGKELFTLQGEYSANLIRKAILGEDAAEVEGAEGLPMRPPALCPGCPHRGTFHVLNKMGLTVTGDIGCYTLGALAPLSAMDTCVCMGSSIGIAMGMEKARGRDFAKRTVAVIGDSTFMHTGINGLIDVVYNKGNTTVLILDNRTTGMTGHQNNPTNGKDIKGEPAHEIDFEPLVRAIGVNNVVTVDSYDLKKLEAAVSEALEFDGPSVIIAKRPCVLLDKAFRKPPLKVNHDKCTDCRECMSIGCPSIIVRNGKVEIDTTLCVGCALCARVCPSKAIGRSE
ncbi:MAG: indolepyruvate ferredoxin oxidoreductase subunit alpha [Clostridia bacterium]|nr:indolepyruvate ferredoxin oxidoreductase subunit alpha [Clostridia bacterium]